MTDYIEVKGARVHNLKNIDVKIPRNQLVVLTGLSGSGKSSLAFDTIYAEGYRKYIESLSVGARQLLEQMDKPEVDYINGLSPVIAIEQREGGVTNPRTTVASVTEILDYARLLWPIAGVPSCPKDGGKIERRTLDDAVDELLALPVATKVILVAPIIKGAKPSVAREEIERLQQKGFSRVRVDGVIRELSEPDLWSPRAKEVTLEVVIDRIAINPAERSRLADSLEMAFREGKDAAIALVESEKKGGWDARPLRQSFSCVQCGTLYPPLTPRHFSYNHPEGACEACAGLGRQLLFAPQLVVPDPTKSVRGGAIKGWRIGPKRIIIRNNTILKQLSEQVPFDPETPWEDLPAKVRDLLLNGDPDRLFELRTWSRKRPLEERPWEGVLAALDHTFRSTSSQWYKIRLMSFQTTSPCKVCQGKRLNKYSLGVRLEGVDFASFVNMPVGRAWEFAAGLVANRRYDKMRDAVLGLERRLHFLNEVGLGYLTLEREYVSLSGGEAQRVRLASQLGMGLVGVTYVLDEPSIGLHPSDNGRLLQVLRTLRDRGNTVLVVEHDESTLQAADYLIELGRGAGQQGGNIVFQGSPAAAMADSGSISGPFLSGERKVDKNAITLQPRPKRWLSIKGARHNNLKNIDAAFPQGLLTCVTGVSGSGKSSLVNDILGAAAALKLNAAKTIPGAHKTITGLDDYRKVVIVDQEPIGKSPRSNPATYIKLFDLLRALYAKTPLSRVRGYTAGRFSFNMRGGRCEKCAGDGVIKLDMQFLADVYVPCPSCAGKRYNRETLEARFKGVNIAEVLEMSVDDAIKLFAQQPGIIDKLETLQAVGLGYLKLGQPANTLSGGEAQRIKLSLELSRRQQGDSLYILDEPTTGLHWLDIQRLMDLLFRLRDAGNTIIIIEHDMNVIRLADWIIDLGPTGGDAGGHLVYSGDLTGLLASKESLTGTELAKFLKSVKTR